MQVIFRARTNLWAEIPSGGRTALVIAASEWALKHPLLKYEVTINLAEWYAPRKSIGLLLPDGLVARIDTEADGTMTRTDWLHWAVVLYQESVPDWASKLPARRSAAEKTEPKPKAKPGPKAKTKAKAAPAPEAKRNGVKAKAKPAPAPAPKAKPAPKAAKPAPAPKPAPKAKPAPATKPAPKAKPAPVPEPDEALDFDVDFQF